MVGRCPLGRVGPASRDNGGPPSRLHPDVQQRQQLALRPHPAHCSSPFGTDMPLPNAGQPGGWHPAGPNVSYGELLRESRLLVTVASVSSLIGNMRTKTMLSTGCQLRRPRESGRPRAKKASSHGGSQRKREREMAVDGWVSRLLPPSPHVSGLHRIASRPTLSCKWTLTACWHESRGRLLDDCLPSLLRWAQSPIPVSHSAG